MFGERWEICTLDNRLITNTDASWHDLSHLLPVGPTRLYALKTPAASLTTVINGKRHTLRAPDQRTFFFREYRDRAGLLPGMPVETMYYCMGYVCEFGKVSLEISAQGHTTLRVDDGCHALI